MSARQRMRGALVALLFTVGFSASGQTPGAREIVRAQDAARVDALLAGVGLATRPVDEAALSSAEAALLPVDFQGLRLRAPERVDLKEREELPLLYARRATGQRDWEVAPQRNAHLVAVDLERGSLYHGWAFRPRKRYNPEALERSRAGTPPDESERTSINAAIGVLEARELTGMPWRAGRYAFTLVGWDWVSNTVVVELTEGPSPVAKPAPLSPEEGRRLLERWRGTGTLLSHKAHAVPKADGVQLSSPSKLRLGAGALVKGVLRMRVPEGMAVSGEAPAARPAAFLPFGLLLVRKDEPESLLVTSAIPIPSTPVRTSEGAVVVHFSLNLGKAAGEALQPGEHLLYLVAGPYIDGPHRAEVTR